MTCRSFPRSVAAILISGQKLVSLGRNWCRFIFSGRNWCRFIFSEREATRGRPFRPSRLVGPRADLEPLVAPRPGRVLRPGHLEKSTTRDITGSPLPGGEAGTRLVPGRG